METHLREIYEMLKPELDGLERAIDRQNAKATFLFGAIILMLGLVWQLKQDVVTVELFIVCFGCELASLACTLYVYQPRSFTRVPNPSAVIRARREGKDLDYIFGQLIANIRISYDEAGQTHDDRARVLKFGMTLAYLGVILFGLSFISF